jgi:hypothetical protein
MPANNHGDVSRVLTNRALVLYFDDELRTSVNSPHQLYVVQFDATRQP